MRLITVGFVCMFGCSAVGLSLFCEDGLRLLVRPEYWRAATVVPILVLAAFAQGIYIYYADVLYYKKGGTRYLPLASIAGSIATLATIAVLMNRYAAIAVAMGTLLGVCVRLGVAAGICRVKVGSPWADKTILAVGALPATLGAGASWASSSGLSGGLWVTAKMALVIGYVGCLILGLRRFPGFPQSLMSLRRTLGLAYGR